MYSCTKIVRFVKLKKRGERQQMKNHKSKKKKKKEKHTDSSHIKKKQRHQFYLHKLREVAIFCFTCDTHHGTHVTKHVNLIN